MAKIKIIALLPLLPFGFPQSEGQELSIEEKQGEEIIEAGYAKLAVDSKALKAEAKAKAEEEAKAKAAEEEAKAKAEEEAKAKAAEEETKAKAEEEAKAKAAEEEAKAAAAKTK